MPFNCIEVVRQGVVAVVTLRRPEKLNALNRAIGRELCRALTDLGDARALVVTGDHRAFSAGADLAERPDHDEGPSMLDALDRLAALPLPTWAAIEGYCLGGGLELALCCDFRVAGRNARLGTPEVLRGILPAGGGTQRLLRLVGPARAKELMFFGSFIDSGTAEAWGLLNRVVDDGRALDASAAWAASIANSAPLAVREIKRLVAEGGDLPLPAALDLERDGGRRLQATDDAREGIQAFLERRPPTFRGR